MIDAARQNPAAAANASGSGEQTLQSFGYGGTAELHNEDKAAEAGGRPIHELSGSTPESRPPAGNLASKVLVVCEPLLLEDFAVPVFFAVPVVLSPESLVWVLSPSLVAVASLLSPVVVASPVASASLSVVAVLPC